MVERVPCTHASGISDLAVFMVFLLCWMKERGLVVLAIVPATFLAYGDTVSLERESRVTSKVRQVAEGIVLVSAKFR